MNKYQLLEWINGLFQTRNEIRSSSIDYKQTKDRSGSIIAVTKDGEVFEIKIRKI